MFFSRNVCLIRLFVPSILRLKRAESMPRAGEAQRNLLISNHLK